MPCPYKSLREAELLQGRYHSMIRGETTMDQPSHPPVLGITAHHDTTGVSVKSAIQGQLESYLRAVAGAGGAPLLIPLNLEEASLRAIFERLDGLLLPGGPDMSPAHFGQEPDPNLGRVDDELDRTELLLTRWAVEADLPLLAICRGIQVLNVAQGGTLFQDLPSQLPEALEHHRFRHLGYAANDQAHEVAVTATSRLAAALDAAVVMTNSRHHQAIQLPAPSLTVVARTADGLIEAVEMPQARFLIGVQWHPENLVDENPPMHRLFASFVAAARGRD